MGLDGIARVLGAGAAGQRALRPISRYLNGRSGLSAWQQEPQRGYFFRPLTTMEASALTQSCQEMHIPKELEVRVLEIVVTSIVVIGCIYSVANLILVWLWNPIQMICSVIWLIFVATIIRDECNKAEGLRKWLINLVGNMFGRFFVEADLAEAREKTIRFGFDLLGRRFIQRKITIAAIGYVEWSKGQASSMTGRDMNDWSVALWFDTDPIDSPRRQWRKSSGQDVIVVGPAKRKVITEAFGLAFVHFLCAAGASLVRGKTENCFVREWPEADGS
jgi:hypothetical protein